MQVPIMIGLGEIYYSTSRTLNQTMTHVEINYGFSRFVPQCAASDTLIMLRLGVSRTTVSPNRVEKNSGRDSNNNL